MSMRFCSASPPWIHISLLGQEGRGRMPSQYYQCDGMEGIVRVLRGNRMQSDVEVFHEIGIAFQFANRMQDGNFGENTNALTECLEDLDSWIPAEFYTIVILNAHQLLPDDGDLAWFLEILQDMGQYWSQPIADGGMYDRPSVPFNTILECPAGDIRRLRDRILAVAKKSDINVGVFGRESA